MAGEDARPPRTSEGHYANGRTSMPLRPEAIADRPGEVHGTSGVAMNADGVDRDADLLAGNGGHRLVLHHADHAFTDDGGIMDDGAGLAAGHQRQIVLIGAIGEDLACERQAALSPGRLHGGRRKHDETRSRSTSAMPRATAAAISSLSEAMLERAPWGFTCVTRCAASAAIACNAPIW